MDYRKWFYILQESEKKAAKTHSQHVYLQKKKQKKDAISEKEKKWLHFGEDFDAYYLDEN